MIEPVVAIRPARPEDYARLCALYEQLDTFHRDARPDVFVKPDGAPRSFERVGEIIAGPRSTMLVAEWERVIAGFATIIVRRISPNPVRPITEYAELDEIVVDAAHRRRGMATLLIRASEAWAIEHELKALVIGVWAFNEGARAVYERAGYEVQTLRLAKRL